MKITICGSIAFIDEMLETKKKLEELGHEVMMPPTEVNDENGRPIPAKKYYAIRKISDESANWVWERKAEAIRTHFDKVVWADAVLILNYDKNNVPHYIGANTLLEMGLAFHHGKKIYLLNPIPGISYKEEILGMRPSIVNGNLSLLNC